MQQISFFDELIVEEKPKYSNWLLVDGNNLLNRAFFATANKVMTAPDGRPTNAVTQFIKMTLNYQKQFNANIVVFFDKGKGFRKKLFPTYKDGRSDTPELLVPQFTLIRELLAAGDIPYFWSEVLEADDLIGSACRTLSGHKYVLSNDQDLLQLIRDDVTIVVRKKKVDVLMTPKQFTSDWAGLSPNQVVDIKALAGDTSDNIPGVVGIGDKGAFNLIKHFEKVESIKKPFPQELKRYESKFENDGMKNALFFKDLTTLKVETPLQIKEYEINVPGLIAMCEKLALESVITLLNKS